MANCNPKIDTPPVPCSRTVSPAFSLACSIIACQTVTAAQGSVAPSSSDRCGGIFTAPSSSSTTYSRKHAVDAAAQRALVRVGCRLAATPALKEVAGDAIADLHPADARTDFDHFAGAVRQRNKIFTHCHAIAAAHNGEIAEIERAGSHLHEDLAMCGLWLGTFDLYQRVDAGTAFGQLIGTHVFSSLTADRCGVVAV